MAMEKSVKGSEIQESPDVRRKIVSMAKTAAPTSPNPAIIFRLSNFAQMAWQEENAEWKKSWNVSRVASDSTRVAW